MSAGAKGTVVAVVCGIALSGCGPRISPREAETGLKPGQEAAIPVGPDYRIDKANAFPSIGLDLPAPDGIPGVDAAETAAAKAPNSASAVLNVGYAYYAASAYPQSAEQFAHAATLAPGDAAPRLYEGLAQMGAGHLDAAADALTRVTQLKGVPTHTLGIAYAQIGRCRFQQHRDDAAKAAFLQSLAVDPHQGQASLGLGAYAALAGDIRGARKRFTIAAQDLPPGRQRALAFASLGRLEENVLDRRAALAAYRRALTENPDSTVAREALARLAVGAKPAAKGGA